MLDISCVYGTKFSADGSLLVQPMTNGIDVIDGRLGNPIAFVLQLLLCSMWNISLPTRRSCVAVFAKTRIQHEKFVFFKNMSIE